LVSKATTNCPLPDACLHLFNGRDAARSGKTPSEQVIGLVEDRREDESALAVDASVYLTSGSQFQLFAQRARNRKLALDAHRQCRHASGCKASRLTPQFYRGLQAHRPYGSGLDALRVVGARGRRSPWPPAPRRPACWAEPCIIDVRANRMAVVSDVQWQECEDGRHAPGRARYTGTFSRATGGRRSRSAFLRGAKQQWRRPRIALR